MLELLLLEKGLLLVTKAEPGHTPLIALFSLLYYVVFSISLPSLGDTLLARLCLLCQLVFLGQLSRSHHTRRRVKKKVFYIPTHTRNFTNKRKG